MRFILYHKDALLLGAAWLYSALMSSMPQVDLTKLTFPRRWLLSFMQLLAANVHRV